MVEKLAEQKETVLLYAPGQGLKINRVFTQAGKDPLETQYELRKSTIRNPDGSVVFELTDIEVPKSWSQVATDIVAQKYFRKAGVPQFNSDGTPVMDANGKQVTGSEKSAKQVVKRLAGCWRYWGEKYGYFASTEDAQAFEDEMLYMLIHQMASPNSPQWFNTGLAYAYDIRGTPQGHHFVDPVTKELKQSDDAYTRPQAQACFIQSVNDDLVNEGGIFDLVLREARVFKFGSGTGSNFSALRAKGEKLAGGGTSSGLMSFLKIFDNAAGAIKCLHEDTELVTKRGIVKIKEIKRGDLVLTKNGYKEVNQVFDNGTRETVRIKTGLGFEVTCTPEHMFWVRTPSGQEVWKETKNITQQDFVCIDFSGHDELDYKPLNEVKPKHFNEKTITFPKYLDERMAEWLGWIYGDGNITERKYSAYVGVQIGLIDPDLIDKYTKLAKDLFGVHVFTNKRQDKLDNSISVRIASKQLIRFLTENDLRKGKANELKIPKAIKESPASVRAAFLRGFFEADGTIEKNTYPACSSISKQLIKEVQLLLQSIGIISKSFESTSRETSFGKNPLYRIIVTSSFGIKGFAEKISFISERKKLVLDHALEALIERPFEQQWILPYFEEEFEEMYTALSSNQYEIRRATSKYFRETTGKTNFNKFRANKLVNKFPTLGKSFIGALANSNIYYDTITVEKVGVGHVYDIEVNDGHQYLVNGLVTHNSGGTTRRAAKMVILNADHPEIESFVTWKMQEEAKVADLYTGSRVISEYLNKVMGAAREAKTTDWKNSETLRATIVEALAEKVPFTLITRGLQLVEQGIENYDAEIFNMHYEGKAYETVSGQNSNNSVRLPNAFMDANLEDGYWNLTARTTGQTMKRIKASELFDKIAFAAWACADPGLQFDDTIQEWNTCPVDGKINATNPCVTGDTMVLTNEGRWHRIDNLINKPTELITNLNSISTGATKGAFETGTKQVYKLETESGYEVKLTGDHRVFTVNRGFVQAVELTKDDLLCLPSQAVAEVKELGENEKRFYQLIGLYLGDGCGSGNTIQITMEKDAEEPVLQAIANYGTTNFTRQTHQFQAIKVKQAATSAKIHLGGESLVEKVSQFVDLNLKSHEKIISPQMFALSLSEQRYILQGLFTADGTVADCGEKSQYVALDSTSLEMLNGVQVLLSGFGIKSKLYKNRRAGKTKSLLPDGKGGLKEYEVREMHSLRVSRSSRVVFEKLIGFMIESPKALALKKLNERVSTYNDAPYEYVKSLEYIGEEKVYDLTEPLTNSFIANGITVHNCSEFVFLDNTSCNLASLNLMKFFNEEKGVFEVDNYIHATRLWTIVLELSVLMAHFPGKEIAKRTFETRTLGLGYANLGSMLMVLGIPYDSDKGRAIASAITAMMCGECYATSAEMAKYFGSFPAYERNKEHMLKVIRNHRRAAYNARDSEYEGLTVKPIGINPDHCPEYLLTAAQQCMDKALTLGEQHGYRNAQVNLIAPTGCLTSDSLVSTERGLVPLGTLGDVNGQQWQDISFKVPTHEGEKLATKFFINGVAQTRRIRTASGFEIQGTPQHRIKVVDSETGEWKWKHFADVTSGDVVPLAMNSMIGEPREVRLPPVGENYWNQEHKLKVPKTTSPELAELVGYFMGDGSLHSKGLRLCVTKEDNDVAQRIADLSKQLFNLEAHVEEKQGYLEVALHSVNLALWWEASGFDKLLPHINHSGKGYTPRIPTAILYTNDKKCYSAFIKGLFEADGTVTNGAPSWTTAKKEFAMQVKSLLLALGFPTSINLCKSQWGQSTLYVLRVLNQSYNGEFKKQIGFIGARKNNAITISSEGHASRRDYIHLPDAVMQKAIQTGIAKNALTMSLKRRNALTRRSVKQIYEVTNDSEIGQALNFYYDIVDANEDGGEQLTYDLSVPENVTYIANGFVSHNTIALQMDCDTTGVEPDFAIVKFKKLAGGGYLKIVNQSVEKALHKLGYTAQQVMEIEDYCKGKGTLQNCPGINHESLKQKGFTDEKLAAVEKQLGSAFDIAFVFNKFTLGEEFCVKLGFTKQQINSQDFNMLDTLGFTSEQVQKANDYVCGTMTIEGAPHLKEEHYPIFDCANKCGRYGKRFIHYDGHLKMMAATQPFMSGAISKTINMPNDATVQDVKDAYLKSWKYMLKAIALYRDGSKLSQPLNTVSQAEDELTKLIGSDENDVDEQVGAKQLHEEILIRGQKMKMPTKRAGFVQEARIGGQKLFLRTGEYENGQLGEIFVDMYKEGASYRSILNCFAIAISKGLQYGVPLEEFIETFSFSRFEPSGVVNGDESITNATSILDYVFKALEREYVLKQRPMAAPIVKAQRTLNPTDLPQESAKPTVTFTAPASGIIKPVEKTAATVGKIDAKALGYTGEQCGRCGSMKVKRNGACSVCIDCGETTGCS